MNWWCAATSEPWSWRPRAYPGIWVTMLALLAAYFWAWRYGPALADPDAGSNGEEQGTSKAALAARSAARRKRWAFIGGWALLWLATDWPLGALGAGYLASAHMAQYVLYTMAAAPLLVVGTPEWMLRRLLSKLGAYRLVKALARPLTAAIIFNIVLVGTHAPITVDTFRANQFGSFLLDAAWLGSALLLWLPVCGPLEELKPSLPVRGVYLFMAAGLFPMIPGGFLTFASAPLYAVYELAPPVGSIDSLSDQQFAGALMKVGNIPLLWPVLGVLFIRWANEESRASTPPMTRRPTVRSPGAPPTTGSGDGTRSESAATAPPPVTSPG